MEGKRRRKYAEKRKKAGTEEGKKEQRDEQLAGLLGIDNYMIPSYRVEHHKAGMLSTAFQMSQQKASPKENQT